MRGVLWGAGGGVAEGVGLCEGGGTLCEFSVGVFAFWEGGCVFFPVYVWEGELVAGWGEVYGFSAVTAV